MPIYEQNIQLLASERLTDFEDGIDDKTLLAQANAGLGFDEAAYLASQKD